MQQIREKIKEDFVETALQLHEQGGYALLVPLDSRWLKQPPRTNDDIIMIIISNWSHEETKVDKSGIHVKCAFGEDESEAYFTWEQVLGLFTVDLEPLLMNNLSVQKPKKVSIYDFMDRDGGAHV